MSPVRITPPYFSKIHFNIILPPTSVFLNTLFPSGFPTKTLMYLVSPHTCYMPCPSHPPWLHSNYTWRTVQVKKLLIMQFPPTSYNLKSSIGVCLPPAFTLVSCSAYCSTLKMEAICSSETLVDFKRITLRYIPVDSTLHNHRCENLKSYDYSIPLRSKYSPPRCVHFLYTPQFASR
jgi:hypothetical protein